MFPGAGLTLYEQMGLADQSQRFTRTDGTTLGTWQPAAAGEHERVRRGCRSSRICKRLRR